MRHLRLEEWETIGAAPTGRGIELRDLWLDDPCIAKAANQLGDCLRVGENRHGLTLAARQHVGAVQMGSLRVVIRPKIPADELWHILSYGLGLPAISRHAPIGIASPEATFQDLLAMLLHAEAQRLQGRGIRRGYVRRHAWLEAPRGQIDLDEIARHGVLTRAALPCTYHEMSADILANQVVLAGLRVAKRVVESTPLRARLDREIASWSEICSRISLSQQTLPAIVLYPQSNGARPDVELALNRGQHQSPIILRAVDWEGASRLLRRPDAAADRAQLAERWTEAASTPTAAG